MPKKILYDDIKNHIESFGYILLSNKYINAQTKLKVKCPLGHEYDVTWCNFKNSYRCPVCSGNKKLTYDYVKDYIEKKGYTLLSDAYNNAQTKLKVKCPMGHEYNVRFYNFKNGKRCPYCAGNKRLTYDYVKSFIKKEGYLLLSDCYKNNRTRLLLKCPEGHEYKVNFRDFKNGNRCPICHGGIKLTYDYVKDFIDKEGYQLLSHVYRNNGAKLSLKCPEGHEYKVNFRDFKNGNRCPICAGNQRHTYEYIKQYIEQEGYQLLSKTYINAFTKLLTVCPKGHEYKTTFNNFQRGYRCSTCWYESTSSKQEVELQNFIESLGYSIIRNDRTQIFNPLTGYNLELDVWVPDKKKAIEYNGTYWHSRDIQKNRDRIKEEQCKQKGIDLLVINEDKWVNSKCVEQIIIKKFLEK